MPTHGLYIAWNLNSEPESAGTFRQFLMAGEESNLYRLRSWMIADGQAKVLLIPFAPLEEIAEAIWTRAGAPKSTLWITGKRNCAAATREIEIVPVQLGLVRRPEEWRWSSAFRD